MTEYLNLGLIGLGYIGKIHSNAYRNIPVCFTDPPVAAKLKGVLRSQLKTEKTLMDELGFELRTTDPDEFFSEKFDVIDICTPNLQHLEQTRRALESGANVYLEKPMAMDLAEARQMTAMAKEAGAKTHLALVFRYVPAVRQMKALIQAGEIGEVFNFRARLFHGSYVDPNRPMAWRLRWAESGGGVFADLGSHMIDMIRYLLGDVASVRAEMRTFIKERFTAKGSQEREPVDVDDWMLCLMEMANGAPGVIEVTRMAAGVEDSTAVEIYGSKGALRFNFAKPDLVDIFDARKNLWYHGPVDVPAVEGERPIHTLWPSGKYSQGIMTNAHLACSYDFLQNVAEDKESDLDFSAGMAVQEVLEAAYRSARAGGEKMVFPL